MSHAPAPASATVRPRVLLIAPHASYRTAPFLAAAERLGVEVLIASRGRHSVVASYAEGLHVELDDSDRAFAQLVSEAERRPFAGVVATDDSTAELGARLASTLGLPHNPAPAVHLTRRKDQARAHLQRAGAPVPGHRLIDLDAPLAAQADTVSYPCVLKPLSMSASRGVIRVDDPERFVSACTRIAHIVAEETDSDARRYLLAEDFIPGFEVAIEGMLHYARLSILAIFDKPDPLDGPFFEETYYVMPTRLDAATQETLHAVLAKACAAYGLREGPIHAECRINERGVWILEIAARTIGGLCARLLRWGTGYGLEELVLAQAMGRPIAVQPIEGGAGVLMIPIPRAGILRRVEGLSAASRVPCIEDIVVAVREGYELTPLPEGASYLGFIYARAPDARTAEATLRAAHSCLNIVIAPLFKPVVKFSPAAQ